MKIHLLDGTYELFRSYFGAPKARNAAGREVGAVRGLARSFAALLRDPGVTHVACAFDTVIESFRNDLFDGYKTGEGIEPELHQQFPLAEQVTRAIGMETWSMHEFEADDALATGAARWRGTAGVEQVVLCSPDKDLAQCVVGREVVMFDRRREVTLDDVAVVEKFGVGPVSIPDYLALVGDSADGIPGIPGFGAKSTAAVLSHYLKLEAIPDSADDWGIKVRGAARLAANLAERRDDAQLYRTLAVLRTDVPLSSELEDLRWSGPSGDLGKVLAELGIELRLPDGPGAS